MVAERCLQMAGCMQLKLRVWLTKEDAHHFAFQMVGPERDDVVHKLVVEGELLMVEDRLHGDLSHLQGHW